MTERRKQLLTKTAFARRAGVAASRVSQWISTGMPVEKKSGKIDVAKADKWLADNLDAARRNGWSGDGMPKAKGGEQYRRRKSTGSKSEPVPTLKELGIEKKRSSQAQKRDTLADARRARENIKGEREKLALAKDKGELIERATVRRFLEARGRLDRDAHMGWVSRTAAVLAGEFGVDAAKLYARLDAEMRLHLRELSETPIAESEGVA